MTLVLIADQLVVEQMAALLTLAPSIVLSRLLTRACTSPTTPTTGRLLGRRNKYLTIWPIGVMNLNKLLFIQ